MAITTLVVNPQRLRAQHSARRASWRYERNSRPRYSCKSGSGRYVCRGLKRSKMSTINSEQFGEICNAVWRDRAAVLRGRGSLSGEATLVRAVFWRLCKAGVKSKGSAEHDASRPAILAYQLMVGRMLEVNGRPAFDCAPILKELVEHYQNE